MTHTSRHEHSYLCGQQGVSDDGVNDSQILWMIQVGMVMAKVRAAIDGDAPTALFFKAPTISGLAREIEVLSAATAQAKPISAAPYTVKQLSKGIPCWPLQEHLLFQVWRLTV